MLGLEVGDLTAKLRADRTAAARYQYRLSDNIAAVFLRIKNHRLSAEQILHLHLTDRRGDRNTRGHEVVDIRNNFDLKMRVGTGIQNTLFICYTDLRDRKQNDLDPQLIAKTGNLVCCACYRNAGDFSVKLFLVIIDNTDRDIFVARGF